MPLQISYGRGIQTLMPKRLSSTPYRCLLHLCFYYFRNA